MSRSLKSIEKTGVVNAETCTWGCLFGFNGQERDDEVVGAGNSYTAEYWQYDARLGRRWNTDPVVKSDLSVYSTFSNSPIMKVDPNGDDDYYDRKGKYLGSVGENSGIMRVVNSNDAFVEAKSSGNHAGKVIIVDDNVARNAQLVASATFATGREHTMNIIFDPDKALIYSELDPAGTATNSNPYESSTPNKVGPRSYEELNSPKIILGSLHGHPKENRPGLINESNLSHGDAQTAKEQGFTKYAVDAYK